VDTRGASSASTQKKPDGYAAVRKRLHDMQSRLDAAKAGDFARADGNPTGRVAALRSKSVAAKTQQLSDAVRAAIDAEPTLDRRRKLLELRDRLRQKKLDEVLSERDSAAVPVTPTLTTSIHHR
jgi:hypothetical protein